MGRPSTLPEPAEELILRELRKSRKPLGAYHILEKVKKFGIKNSPIVYRALNVLIKQGEAHRINELNAFVACNCKADHRHALSVIAVCTKCQKVEELHDYAVIGLLEGLRERGVNLSENAVIELPVVCGKCSV